MATENSRTIAVDARAERGFEPDMFRVEIEFAGECAEKAECVETYYGDLERVLAALAAVVEARSRAEVLALAAGVKLGDVASISYGFSHAVVLREMHYEALTSPDFAEDGLSAPELNPEPISVNCDVSISWLIA